MIFTSLFNEYDRLDSAYIHLEFYDGSGWINAHNTTEYEASRMIFQDNSQNIRVANGSGSTAYKISLTGITW